MSRDPIVSTLAGGIVMFCLGVGLYATYPQTMKPIYIILLVTWGSAKLIEFLSARRV